MTKQSYGLSHFAAFGEVKQKAAVGGYDRGDLEGIDPATAFRLGAETVIHDIEVSTGADPFEVDAITVHFEITDMPIPQFEVHGDVDVDFTEVNEANEQMAKDIRAAFGDKL